MAEELHRRSKELGKGGGEDSIIIPQEPSLPPYMMTTSYNINNNSKKEEKKSQQLKNTKKEEQLEQDRHDIEQRLPSRPNLLIDDEDDYGDGSSIEYDYVPGGYWIIKRNIKGDIIDVRNIITDPLLDAQEYYYQQKKKSSEKLKQNERALLEAFQ